MSRVWRCKGWMTLRVDRVFIERRKLLFIEFDIVASGVRMSGRTGFRRRRVTPWALAKWIIEMKVEAEYNFDRRHVGKDVAEERKVANLAQLRGSAIAGAGGRWLMSAICEELQAQQGGEA